MAIADTWDAMTGNRVYRKGMRVETSLRILEEEQDSGQWDPELVREFITMIKDEQNIRYIHTETEQALNASSG